MGKSIPVGLTNLYYALLDVNSDVVGGAATYGAPVRIGGAISANFSPNASNDTIFADDGPYETASTLGAMTLELNIADLTNAERAALLGGTYDAANGTYTAKETDIPPFVAIGCQVKKSNGANRFVWYLKGKFTAPDDSNQTKADSINWATPTITGNFLARDCDDKYRVALDSDEVNANASAIANWFTTPNILENVCGAPVMVGTVGIVGDGTGSGANIATISKGAALAGAFTTAEAASVTSYKMPWNVAWVDGVAGTTVALSANDILVLKAMQINDVVAVSVKTVKATKLTATKTLMFKIIA